MSGSASFHRAGQPQVCQRADWIAEFYGPILENLLEFGCRWRTLVRRHIGLPTKINGVEGQGGGAEIVGSSRSKRFDRCVALTRLQGNHRADHWQIQRLDKGVLGKALGQIGSQSRGLSRFTSQPQRDG